MSVVILFLALSSFTLLSMTSVEMVSASVTTVLIRETWPGPLVVTGKSLMWAVTFVPEFLILMSKGTYILRFLIFDPSAMFALERLTKKSGQEGGMLRFGPRDPPRMSLEVPTTLVDIEV